MLSLSRDFLDRGIETDIVLLRREGELIDAAPSRARVFDLGVHRIFASIPALAQYLRRRQPSVLLSATSHPNRAALWARALSRVSTRIVVSHHSMSLSSPKSSLSNWTLSQLMEFAYPYGLMRFTYSFADGIIAVSEGVAANISQSLNLQREKIKVIYNPVLGPKTFRRAEEDVEHPWFSDASIPVIIGVGRLVDKKNFSDLLRAFARLSSKRDTAKLAILGEGRKRSELETLATTLNVDDRVWMPGFVQNPLKYMARSDVFVSSSIEEGLGNALIEAMATGTPVVATNCKGGPSEVLKGGKYGKLVPVEDPSALSTAIGKALDGQVQPAPRSALDRFRRGTVADQYLDILNK